jgi:hypothetical protein
MAEQIVWKVTFRDGSTCHLGEYGIAKAAARKTGVIEELRIKHADLSVVGTPTKDEIAARLRRLADEMDDIAVTMDYYGGFAVWAQHGREIAGAGTIARQWAGEIEASNAKLTGAQQREKTPE